MRILVTGGSGFLGTAVCQALEEDGYEVDVFDISLNPEDDITEHMRVNQRVRGCEAVVHLAGLLGTDELFDSPYDAVDVNVTGTLNVLDACVDHGAQIVGISMPDVFPSIYTSTRTCARNLITAYHHAHGLPTAHVQAFNVFGPGQKHGPGHPRKIIPAFAVEGWSNKPMIVWGDGEQTVDLISSKEIGKIFRDALIVTDDSTIDGGTGHQWTVNEVAAYVIERTGSTAGIEYRPMRRGEVASKIGARGQGWFHLTECPRFNLIELDQAIESYKDHPLVG